MEHGEFVLFHDHLGQDGRVGPTTSPWNQAKRFGRSCWIIGYKSRSNHISYGLWGCATRTTVHTSHTHTKENDSQHLHLQCAYAFRRCLPSQFGSRNRKHQLGRYRHQWNAKTGWKHHRAQIWTLDVCKRRRSTTQETQSMFPDWSTKSSKETFRSSEPLQNKSHVSQYKYQNVITSPWSKSMHQHPICLKKNATTSMTTYTILYKLKSPTTILSSETSMQRSVREVKIVFANSDTVLEMKEARIWSTSHSPTTSRSWILSSRKNQSENGPGKAQKMGFTRSTSS